MIGVRGKIQELRYVQRVASRKFTRLISTELKVVERHQPYSVKVKLSDENCIFSHFSITTLEKTIT